MRKHRLAILAGATSAALTGMVGAVHASSVAQDVSTNYTTFTDFNGQNLGSGFGAFNIVQSGTTGGDFVDTAANGGFDIYDNGTQSGGSLSDQVSVIRPFTGALTTGQDFSFTQELHFASNPANGGPSNLGFSLDDSSGNPLFDFHIQGGGSGYLLSDATQSVTQTTTPYNYNSPDTFSFTLNNAATGAYTFTVSGASVTGGPQTFTGTVSTATGGVSEVNVYNNNGGGGSDMHFDNFSITNGGSAWALNASADWNNAADWTNSIVPNASGAVASFLGIISTAQTVFSNTPVTVGVMNFNNANTYVIAGAGSLTLQASTGSAQINVMKGSHTIQLPTIFASNTTLDVLAGSTLNLTNAVTIDSGVAITQTGGGAVDYSNVITLQSGASVAFAGATSANSLNVANTAVAAIGGTGSTLKLDSLSNSGTVNVENNVMIINYGSSTDPATTIYGYLKSGYAGGAWTGTGINSSAAALPANNAHYGVGYVDGADHVPGATISSGQLEVAYALYGDVNLDGLVNATDFAIFGANFNKAVTGWDHGDFTYTGLVNGTDFALLGSNFGKASNGTAIALPASDYAALDAFAAANGLSLPSVPEPASIGVMMLAGLGIISRRKRRIDL